MADSPIILGIFAKAVGTRLSKENDRIAVEEPLELRLDEFRWRSRCGRPVKTAN